MKTFNGYGISCYDNYDLLNFSESSKYTKKYLINYIVKYLIMKNMFRKYL